MAGITAAGFERKLEADLFAEVIDEERATVDPAIDDSPDSVTGQITGIVCSKAAELWEVLEAVYNGLSPSASGLALDRVAAWTNTFRRMDESDADLRLRRLQELADGGTGTVPALTAALSKLANVTAVRVNTNRSMVDLTGANGLPPKSVEAVVIVSDESSATVQPIIDTIWKNLPAGIEAYGTWPVDYFAEDEEGHSQLIGISIAAASSKFVRVSAEIDEGVYPGDDVLKQTLVDFTGGRLLLEMSNGNEISGAVALGGTLYRSRIAAAAQSVPGVIGVTRVEFSDNGVDYTDADHPLDPREYLGQGGGIRGFELGHIAVLTT